MKRRILMTGNEAIAEAAMQAGCVFYAGYPITPQNELIAYMADHLPRRGGIFIQAESELAAVNMVFGASLTGARAMTSSSSPGVSLKQEGISYLAGAELPAVIVNMMRGGPGLGNISPSQSDYFQATKGGGHGDYHCIVVAPASVNEAFELTQLAFTLADKYRTPAVILGDGLLGQMMEPVEQSPVSRKEKGADKSWVLTGCKGRPPRIIRSLYLGDGVLEEVNLRIQKRYDQARRLEQRWETISCDAAEVIVVAYGTMARIAKAAVNTLRAKGKKVGLIRPITVWPFPEKAFAQTLARNKKARFLVVEMSYGQMVEDVKLAINGRADVSFLGRAGGAIPQENEIIKILNGLL